MRPRRCRLGAIDDEVLVEDHPFAAAHLTDRAQGAEIENRAGDGNDLAGRNVVGVGRRVGVGEDAHLVIEDGRRIVEVEVGVLGEVDQRRRVGHRLDFHGERRRRLDDVAKPGRHSAGIAFLAIRAVDGERHAGGIMIDQPPWALAEAAKSAVQVIAAVLVHRHLIGVAVDREPAGGDSVGRAADNGAEMRRMLEVVVELVEAEHQWMLDTGQPHIADHRPQGDDPDAQFAGGDRHLANFGSVRSRSKSRGCHCTVRPPCRGGSS